MSVPLAYLAGPSLFIISLPLACVAVTLGVVALLDDQKRWAVTGIGLGGLALAIPLLQVFVLAD